VAIWNDQARDGKFGTGPLRIGKEAQRRASIEDRFGEMVDAFLAKRGLHVDDDSRWRLLDRASTDLAEAAKKLARNADGDYSPDDYAKRFPAFEHPRSDAPSHSLTELVTAWRNAAQDRGVKKRDADRIEARFCKLIAFLKHDDARRVTKRDIVRWRDHRHSQDISVKTINDSDIASFSNVFNWGVERGWLDQNPAEKATIKSKRQKAKTRDEFFSSKEIAAILRHAAATVGSDREDRKTTAAKRWVPWLLAYSGARVAEMVQLRKQDVRKDDEHGWIIRLDPDAGSIKTNRFCDVPVHEHLIAEGFLDFVQASEEGHLFCRLGADGTIQGSASGIYSRVRDHVREVVADKDVQPNHAWRYTFKTMGLEARIDPLILDALSNHAPGHQGGKYTKVTLKARAEAMAQFPRYKS
jgi:site-specific recombinase XerD